MGDFLYEDLTREIIGAAFTVHTILGPGFLESIYEEALAHELSLRRIAFKRQVRLPIMYKCEMVGEHILDLLVDNKVVVELKAVTELADVHKAITWSAK